MGLDITAYRKLARSHLQPKDDEDGYDAGLRRFCNNTDFPGRFDGLVEGAFYSAAETFAFAAGSYGGYSIWRHQLAQLADYPSVKAPDGHWGHDAGARDATEGPFWELINFSDCEGTIGPVVASKLRSDFDAFAERAAKHQDERFRKRYADWHKAFTMAADSGAVDFH